MIKKNKTITAGIVIIIILLLTHGVNFYLQLIQQPIIKNVYQLKHSYSVVRTKDYKDSLITSMLQLNREYIMNKQGMSIEDQKQIQMAMGFYREELIKDPQELNLDDDVGIKELQKLNFEGDIEIKN